MGDMNHHAIVATTWNDIRFKKIQEWISTLDRSAQQLFIVGQPMVNKEQTVVMVPDGSKEGWGDSDACDDLRDEFIFELERASYDDGSSPWRWVEVGFGDYGQKVLRGNNKNCLGSSEYAG